MSIQPSVLIWTVICFCLLMLILDRLLFRPMLKFMDERQAKIDLAAQKRAADRQTLEQADLMLEERKQRNAALTAAHAEEELRAAQGEAEQRIRQARQESERDMEHRRAGQAEQCRQYEMRLEQGLEALAETFVAKFIS